jgi:hypothetical protein
MWLEQPERLILGIFRRRSPRRLAVTAEQAVGDDGGLADGGGCFGLRPDVERVAATNPTRK